MKYAHPAGCQPRFVHHLIPESFLTNIQVLRDPEKKAGSASSTDVFYTTAGNGTSVANSRKFGTEIGSQLKAAHVDGVILTST